MTEFMDNLTQYAPKVAILLLVAAVAVRVFVPRFVVFWDRKRRRIPRELHAELVSLLSSEKLVNAYTKQDRYIVEVRQTENGHGHRPRINAWLSPYSRAVKADYKTIKHSIGKSRYYRGRKRIRDVSRHVRIRELNNEERRSFVVDKDDPYKQYVIEFDYNGDPAPVRNAFDAVKTQLALNDWKEQDVENPTGTTVVVSKGKLEERLTQEVNDIDFLFEHPAKTPKSLPMAVSAQGEVWSLATHHTLIIGATGSGKSGPLLSTIVQMAPFVEEGRVELYGIDPKYSDINVFNGSDLFEEMALGSDDEGVSHSIDIINQFCADMNSRSEQKTYDLSKGETGQSISASKEHPWKLLIIDEIFVLHANLMRDKAGKAAWENLEKIMAMGRSLGFFVIAATQHPDQDTLGKIRQNMANFILLRQESEHFNDLFLGKDAAELGYNSMAIPASNSSNGYKYSGIGFVKDEQSKPMKVRFAFIGAPKLGYFANEHGAVSPGQKGKDDGGFEFVEAEGVSAHEQQEEGGPAIGEIDF